MIFTLSSKALRTTDESSFRRTVITKLNELARAINTGVVWDNKVDADQTASVVSAQLGGQHTEQAAEQQRRALQLFAASLSDEQALEVATVFDAWAPDRTCKAGEFLTHGTNAVGDPQLYKVVQDHTSQADWPPDLTASLYKAVGLDDAGHPVWSQPTGAHDAYNKGDVVNYNGTLYESTVDGNVYAPDAYPAGWRVYEEVQADG